jgi:hypothetical protein
MQMELRRQNDIAGRLEGLCGLPFVKHGHVIDSAVSFHKCVHFWDCTIFAMGVLLFLFSTLLGWYIFEAFLYLRMGNCFDVGIRRNHCISYNAFPHYMHIGFDGFV